MMIYLKSRHLSKKENIWDLSIDELYELKFIINDLNNKLNENLFYGNLVGINVLFNQISKSQLCIHGHIELMIKNIDKLNYGCSLLNVRNFDPSVKVLNSFFDLDREGFIKTLEGIRIDTKFFSDKEILNLLKYYEYQMLKMIELGKELRNGKKEISNEFELLLFNGLNPAPANSIYLTNYRNEVFFSSIPELIPPVISLDDVGNLNDEENMYLIKYNATTPNSNFSIMKKFSPLVRPSSKISVDTEYSNNVKILKQNIRKALR